MDYFKFMGDPKLIFSPVSQETLIRKKKKINSFPAVDGESGRNCVITAQLQRLLGNYQGRPFCAVVADPINKLGSLTSPLASVCLQMKANDQ